MGRQWIHMYFSQFFPLFPDSLFVGAFSPFILN